GPRYVASDVAHRTLALDRIAAREAERASEETRAVLAAFVAGVNRGIEATLAHLPVEFAILGYEPEPWTARDVFAALRGFWWSLNGRLQSIVAGEAAERHLPAGPLRDAFLTPEFPEERIVPAGSPHPPAGLAPAQAPGDTGSAGADGGATGSNNWAVGRGRTPTGAGVLGSDPHQPFMLPANWYECRLSGPEDNVVGAAWAGVPGVWFGRNRRVAWGLTNNNTSTRDLYVEEVHPADPARYRDGDEWRPFAERAVEIAVRGREPERLVVRETARGPLVNHLVPAVDPAGDPPLALRWVGQEHLDEVRALVALGRARNWAEFRAALAGWALPSFNWGYADVDGNTGYQCATRMPVRGRVARGFRRASDPADAWRGYVPFDALPSLYNPARGFTASANNAPAPDDYPYACYGAFASGERALRIRTQIEAAPTFDAAACATLQNDTFSSRAERYRAALLRRLAGAANPDVRAFVASLAGWDCRYETDTAAPTLLELFARAWAARVARERFPDHLAPLVAGQGGVALRLLEGDDLDWFAGDQDAALADCARAAVAAARARFGADPAGWTWGAVHLAHFRHPLSAPGNADAFDVGPRGVSGSGTTVRNTGLGDDPPLGAASGAEYRLVADLADPRGIRAAQNIGQSGQPGSPHYRDQFDDWVRGDYHTVAFDRAAVEAERTATVRVEPDGS
ncbi:MAG TPA: penicillin acylase family protein, partial [Thermomicrobiales bacterium]|nr:penicillin acylase family protein [Thermomicrobiales bacterium]